MAIHIKTDGTATLVKPSQGETFTYPELKAFVGGYIERVQLGPNCYMWLNEYGKPNGLPVNQTASVIARPGTFIRDTDFICGDVLIATVLEGSEEEETDEVEDFLSRLPLGHECYYRLKPWGEIHPDLYPGGLIPALEMVLEFHDDDSPNGEGSMIYLLRQLKQKFIDEHKDDRPSRNWFVIDLG